MAGESTVLDVAFDNIANANFQPYQIAAVDGPNSSNIITAALLAPITGNPIPLGPAYDKAKTDQTGAVVPGSAINVRLLGIARVIADGAISVGAITTTSTTTAGQVRQATKAAAGAQPQPALGIALTQAQAAGDRILVLLTPGAMY